MEKEKFAEKVKKMGYDVSFESGAVVVSGKYENYEENLAEIRKIVADLGYDQSWGVKGGVIGGAKHKIKTGQIEKTEQSEPINTDGDFEQMDLFKFMN